MYLDNIDDIKSLVEYGLYVDYRFEGDTALMLASRAGRLDIVRYLIEKGAEVNFQDNDGRTSLHYAVISKNRKMVALLLSSGADPNMEDKQGHTFLYDLFKLSMERGIK